MSILELNENALLSELNHINFTEKKLLKLNSNISNALEKDILNYYLMGVASMLICCFGATGNILSLIILVKRAVGSPTTNLYLISLAVADLCVLLATILTAIKDSRKPEKDQLNMLMWQDSTFIPRAYPYFHATAILFQVTSVWLTVAFTSDRYLMICHPFLAKRWCTVQSTRYVIVAIYMASTIYGLPRYFEYRGFEISIPSDVQKDVGVWEQAVFNDSAVSNQSQMLRIVWYDLSEFGSSPTFMRYYHLWSWNIMVVTLPLLTIAVMNSFLICEVRKSSSRTAKRLHRKPTRRHDTDIMLIGVIIVFIVCQIPAAISHFSWSLIPLKDTKKLSWYLLNEIGNLLIVVNSAINLVLYYLFSRKFRRHFLQLFCPYRLVRNDGLHCVYIPRWVVEYWDRESSEVRWSTIEPGTPTGYCNKTPNFQQRQGCDQLPRPSSAGSYGKTPHRASDNRTDWQLLNGSQRDQQIQGTGRRTPSTGQNGMRLIRGTSTKVSSPFLRCITQARTESRPVVASSLDQGFITTKQQTDYAPIVQ
ncbi:unnamed protein product [Dicrocoelium dendriticum]|nr:unnamed protein product [Dicrocoelium dendriticum]